MIRAVLFDLGGTLHTSDNSPERKIWFAKRLMGRLADYGISIPDTPEVFSQRLQDNAELYKHWSEGSLRELPPAEIWDRYFLREYRIGQAALEPIAEELSFLYDYERVRNLRRPHVRETLEALQSMGLGLGMISNIISRSVLPHFLKEYGIDGYMQCVVMSSETGIRKPDPGIFREAERQLHMTPEELVYVGDTISRDIRGVRRAGWHTMIQIENPAIAHRDAAFVGMGLDPDYYIRDISEIPAIIRSIQQKETTN